MSRDPKDLIRLSETEADRLARLYMEAEREILLQMDRGMAKGGDLRYLRGMLDNVQTILEDLLTGNRQWCEQAIPKVYVAGAEYADGLVSAKLGGGFGGIHQQAVKVLADNTFGRLESVRQVIGRTTEDVYRQYALEATRQSVIGYKSWQEVAKDFRANLRAGGITGFRDKRGREWNMKSYAEMVARTTTMQAHLEGTANRLVEHGHDLVRVSSHAGSCPLCLPYQGKILSLTGRDKDDPRCYATLQEAKDNGLFHPNCRHAYSLFIDLDAEIEALERELGEDGVGPGTGESATPVDIVLDAETPCLVERKTGEVFETTYSPASAKDVAALKDWKFDWSIPIKNGDEVYKINLAGGKEIQGLIALKPGEDSVDVSLVESAPRNFGPKRRFEGVGAHLFAIAAKRSFDLKLDGYVAFEAKNQLIDYYARTLDAIRVGSSNRMYFGPKKARSLVEKYLKE